MRQINLLYRHWKPPTEEEDSMKSVITMNELQQGTAE